jgi:hyperosmotically inducible periplasmic protein
LRAFRASRNDDIACGLHNARIAWLFSRALRAQVKQKFVGTVVVLLRLAGRWTQQGPVHFSLEKQRMKNLLASMLGVALLVGTAAQAADDPDAQAPATTTNASASANDQSAQPGTDGWITTKVKAQLMTTKGIPSTDISVTTTNGVVTLAGVVDSKAQVQKSIALAKAVKGVQRVDSSALTSRN